MGRLRDLVAGRPRDQMMGLSGDVPWTSVIHFFKLNSETYLFTLTSYSRLYSEL